MKKRFNQIRTIVAVLLLLCLLLPVTEAHALQASAALGLAGGPDAAGNVTVNFTVHMDAACTAMGDISVSGATLLSMSVPGSAVRNARFVYSAGTAQDISGVIQINVPAPADVHITLTGSASSVQDFTTAGFSAELTLPASLFVSQTEPPSQPSSEPQTEPPSQPSSEPQTEPVPSQTEPSSTQDQASIDASIAEQIRQDQARKASEEAARNQSEAERRSAEEKERMAAVRAEESREAESAGILETRKDRDQDKDTEEETEVETEASEEEEEDEGTSGTDRDKPADPKENDPDEDETVLLLTDADNGAGEGPGALNAAGSQEKSLSLLDKVLMVAGAWSALAALGAFCMSAIRYIQYLREK